MGMFVYKMFQPGLICRGYQFKVGVNECKHATCVREGFHAAENPLDCLSYYPDFDNSECWLCYADGDVHEDGSDSKISCTRLEILRRMEKQEFLLEAIRFIAEHPKRKISSIVHRERGTSGTNKFAFVIGKKPMARAGNDGDTLILLQENERGQVDAFAWLTETKADAWYDMRGQEVAVCE